MNFRKLTTKPEVEEFILSLPNTVVIDCETTGLNFKKDKLRCIAIADSENSATMILADLAYYVNMIRHSTTVVFHNMNFDLKFLLQNGVDVRKLQAWHIRDTVIYHHLTDENASHKLDDIVQSLWKDNYKEVFWSKYKQFDDAPENEQLDYVCRDTVYTYRLYNMLARRGFYTGLIEHSHKLNLALLQTELNGVKINKKLMIDTGVSLNEEYTTKLAQAKDLVKSEITLWEMSEWTKETNKRKTDKGKANVKKPEFSFDSSKQVGELLYDLIGLPEQKSKNRTRTVDDAALECLQEQHDVIPLIRAFRENRKLYGTYIEGMLEREINGRIYPTFNVCGTVTGRVSHSNPNLGNIPRDGVIRNFFIPDEGMVFLDFDYGMIEVVVAAHFSQDKNLLKIIHEGASKHDITAQALGIPRQLAKTANFAMQYQCSAKKLAKVLNCDLETAEKHWNTYWETYAGEKKVIDSIKKKVDKGEPIVTPFGRHRHFPTKFENFWQKEAAYREAYSALIQGTAADICNVAFYRTSEHLKNMSQGNTMWPVHDSILVQVQPKYVDECKSHIKQIMVDVGKDIKLSLPLTVDVKGPLQYWSK